MTNFEKFKVKNIMKHTTEFWKRYSTCLATNVDM